MPGFIKGDGMKTSTKFAYFVSAFAMIYLTALTFCNIPQQNLDFAKYIMAFCAGVFGTAVSYEIGTSASSARKDDKVKYLPDEADMDKEDKGE